MNKEALSKKTLFWNRVQLIAIFVVFLAPIAGAFLYKPTQFNNYGDLYTPAPELSDLQLQSGDKTKNFSDYKKQGLWTFLVVATDSCSKECEQSILNARQLRAMQGKYLDKLRSVFIYSDLPESVAADLKEKYQPLDVQRADPQELSAWLSQFTLADRPFAEQGSRFYVIDSRGLLMLSYPSDADPNRVKKDLSRLLKSRR